MSKKFKKDTYEKKKGRKAEGIFHKALTDTERWQYEGLTGDDYGKDCEISYLGDDDCYKGIGATCQIKGRTKFNFIKDSAFISFPLENSTLNAAMNSNFVWLLILVDFSDESVYFYRIDNLDIKPNSNSTTNIRVPIENKFPDNEQLLIDSITKK